MIIKYYKEEDLIAQIWVDFKKNTVRVKNYTDDILDRPFGINEEPTMKDFDDFIEDRTIPQTRSRFHTEMKMMGISDISPLGIFIACEGRMAGEPFHAEIIDEKEPQIEFIRE